MDIEIQEQPPAEIGDLIFIDDMMSGRVLQVVEVGMDVLVDKKTQYHRYGLFDLKRFRLIQTFRTDVELRKVIDNTMHTIKKSKEYTWTLRRK